MRPEVLVERHVENARRQLAEARERLKAARRRVVQLEDAVGNWERFAAELRQSYGNDTPWPESRVPGAHPGHVTCRAHPYARGGPVKKLGVAVALVALVVLLAACGGGGGKKLKPIYPAAINMSGDITLDGATFVRGNLSDCAGAGRFADLVKGAPVTVSNRAGEPLAVGAISYGIGTNVYQNKLDECTFRFHVPHVPRHLVPSSYRPAGSPICEGLPVTWYRYERDVEVQAARQGRGHDHHTAAPRRRHRLIRPSTARPVSRWEPAGGSHLSTPGSA